MPSVQALYNQEVLEGHREALAVLRELLKEEKDPLERRKLANAILRARPVKDPEAEEHKTPPAPVQRREKAPREESFDEENEDDEFDDEDALDREAAAIARSITTSPDPLAALERLRSLMVKSMNDRLPGPTANTAESS